MNKSPLVSVIIPTHYRERQLREAITSALGQSYPQIEVVVVDNSGATEYARDIVADFPVDYLTVCETRGANVARTIGANHADGDYIQFLDDDDVLYERKIERQINRFKSTDDDTGVVYCGLTNETGRSFLPADSHRGEFLEYALTFETWPCVNSTMLIKLSALNLILPLEDRPGSDDTGMLIELAQQTDFDFVEEVLVFKRMDGKSRGRSTVALDEFDTIMDEYSHLYDDELWRRAQANKLQERGQILLENRVWSVEAIRSYSLLCRRDPSVWNLGCLLASVFGRPGYRAWTAVSSFIARSLPEEGFSEDGV